MSRSIVHDGFNLSGWQSARNGSDKKLLPFSPIEPIDFVMSDADGAASMVVRVPHEDKKIAQRPFPTLIGFSGYRPVDPKGYGVVTFAEISPARVSKGPLGLDGAIVFACPDQTSLQSFNVVTEAAKSVWTLDHRIIGVYRVIRELETAINAAPAAVCMVQRLPGLTLLCQAAEDVGEGEPGIFRIHSINTVRGSGEFVERAGGEPEYEYDPGKKTRGVAHVRAFNRFGDLSEDDWRIVTVIDGVLSVVGGGGDCLTQQYAITILGDPTEGSFDLTLNFVTGATETITIDFDDDKTDVYDKLAALTGIKTTDGDVPASLAVRGGAFPDWTMTIRIPTDGAGEGLDATSNGVMTVSNNTLSGGIRCRVRLAAVCCG